MLSCRGQRKLLWVIYGEERGVRERSNLGVGRCLSRLVCVWFATTAKSQQ